jgi:hypothetical protein
MAGFAVNLQLLLSHPSATFTYIVANGMQESHFLSHLVSVDDLEPKADNCTKVILRNMINIIFFKNFLLKIYVWHTNTKVPLRYSEKYLEVYNFTYDPFIMDQV